MKKAAARRPETLLSHLGRDPASHFGTVNTPVYHASTLLHETMEDFQEAGRHRMDKGKSSYGRTGTPTTFAFEDTVATLEGGYGGVAVSSGLQAVAVAMMAFAEAGKHFLVPDSVYFPARKICHDLLRRLGVETTFYDPTIGAGIAELMRENTALVYMESPGSLTFEVQDVPAIVAAAKAAGVVTVIDNTWATPLYYRPLEHGVDVVLHAATKYMVGHSDAMLGVVVSGEAHYERLRRTSQYLGCAAAPDDVYLGLRGLRTLAVRLERHQANALALTGWLGRRPEVDRLLYPALPGDPGHALWKRDFTGASGLFGFTLQPCSREAVMAFIDGLELYGIGASWGGYESLILLTDPASMRTATRWEPAGPTLRIHAGLEHADDLIADLEAGFARLAQLDPKIGGGGIHGGKSAHAG
ncbi:cystathionine beta-lyase [Pelagibius marinus]|uniref:cystathionine beta-lyase n=1 Tax=Pelagibius marinus TaxID=2762760 RepID=UPI001872534C|nr:cystathionine beta-lyase [Pelagibius marinus]